MVPLVKTKKIAGATSRRSCFYIYYTEVICVRDTTILYLPNTTTKEEIKEIREKYKEQNITVILMISGQEKLIDNLQSLIRID